MPEMKSHAPGTFCWDELATTDASAAQKFYATVFGWEASDMPLPQGGTYTMLARGGKQVGALFPKSPEMKNVPPHWGVYIAVANADEAVAKAEKLGARVVSKAFDVMDVGRMAVLQDPTGATFSVWQAKKHIGAELVGETGSVVWHELETRDTHTARKFYGSLFGWEAREDKMSQGSTYTTFRRGTQPVAGMMELGKDMAQVPPHWLVYFGSEDTDRSTEIAKSAGARVVVPPMDVPGVGKFSVLTDPQGAAFAMIKFATPKS
jgi:uncharacterized protein